MRVKTNCPIQVGPSGSSAFYITKAFQDLGHELVTDYEADLVINIDGMPFIDKLPDVPYFLWDCDSFLHGPNESMSLYDKVFIGGCPEDLAKYPKGTVFLPHAFDEDIHKPSGTQKQFDIVMIGNTDNNLYLKRNEAVKRLATRFNVYHDQIEFGQPYAEAMSKGKLIFNMTLGEKNIPMRFFEGMAIGALLENYNDNLDALAKPHVHYIPYKDNDLLIMAEYYLNHDDEREDLVLRARQHALELHTYKHRVQAILSHL